MNKKLLALLATGALIITGCATKGNVKNKEDDNKKTEQSNNSSDQKKEEDNNTNKEQNTTETTENRDNSENNGNNGNNSNDNNSVNSESKNNNNNTQTVKTGSHDFAAAKKLVDIVGVSGNDVSRLSSQTNLLHWLTQSKIKTTKAANGETLFTVSSADYLDAINAVTSKTYTKEEAINLLKGSHFSEKDGNSAKSNAVPKEDEVYYYKGDNVIAFTTRIMGNNHPQEVESQNKWVVEGDKIKINVVDKMTKTKISTITLKINNKQYAGGNVKSKYYVESIKSN
jgi:probable serine/threonine-protein kinase DDB_G0267686